MQGGWSPNPNDWTPWKYSVSDVQPVRPTCYSIATQHGRVSLVATCLPAAWLKNPCVLPCCGNLYNGSTRGREPQSNRLDRIGHLGSQAFQKLIISTWTKCNPCGPPLPAQMGYTNSWLYGAAPSKDQWPWRLQRSLPVVDDSAFAVLPPPP